MKIFMFKITLLTAFVLLGTCPAAHAGWYNASWDHRKQITIDDSMTPNTDQTNFPVLIYRATDADLAADAQDDGDDILFTSSNGTTKLDHEIEKFDGTTGELWAWVEIPTLANATDTVIYMYYGNGAAANQQNATGVWDANYEAVWHFGEGSGTTVLDSTSSNNDATLTQSDNWIDGPVGPTYDFDGADEATTDGNFTAPTTGTLEFWWKTDNSGTNCRPLGMHDGWELRYHNNVLKYDIQTPGGNEDIYLSENPFTSGQWYHAVFLYDGATQDWSMYLDGAADNSGNETLMNQTVYSSTMYFGDSRNRNEHCNGAMDEIRVSSIERSADWIVTGYNNMSAPATYLTVASEESEDAYYKGGSGDGHDMVTFSGQGVARRVIIVRRDLQILRDAEIFRREVRGLLPAYSNQHRMVKGSRQ